MALHLKKHFMFDLILSYTILKIYPRDLFLLFIYIDIVKSLAPWSFCVHLKMALTGPYGFW